MVWDKFKNAIFEEDPAEAAKKKAQAPSPAPAPAPAAGVPAGTMHSFAPVVNTAMVEAIRKATFSRNTALTALIQQSENFADVIPDPVMRLRAAHKAGGARSPKEIADAITIHLSDVDGEEMRFAQMLNGKVDKEVGGLTRQAEACDSQVSAATSEIQSLSQRVAQLQQQIGEAQARASTLRAEASAKEHELRQAEVEFKAAASTVRTELNGHKNTILSTLG